MATRAGPRHSVASVPSTLRAWSLQLEAGLGGGAASPSEERMTALADLMARMPGVHTVAVEPPSCPDRLRLTVTVDGYDLRGAMKRAVALLRACASYAGLGDVRMVCAHCPAPHGTWLAPSLHEAGVIGIPFRAKQA